MLVLASNKQLAARNDHVFYLKVATLDPLYNNLLKIANMCVPKRLVDMHKIR